MMSAEQTSTQERKPRIMIGGEFSAGKSKLINGLIGRSVLPSQVTSTSLPPVWIVYGSGDGIAVDVEGSVKPLDFDHVDVETTAYCVLPVEAPILAHVDLIDTPGNSDPNIPPQCWERMIGFADGLVWCSSAMQAWRQSEKSACAAFPRDLLDAATLLITQIDRLPDARSRDKVMARVKRESAGIFDEIRMASLIRDADVQDLATLLAEIAPNLPRRGGKAPLVEQCRAKAPALATNSAASAKPTSPEPQKPDIIQFSKPKTTPGAPAPVSAAETLRLVRDAVSDAAPAPAPRPASAQTPARKLWASVTEGADLDDPAQLSACVEALLARLDALSAKGSAKAAVSAKGA